MGASDFIAIPIYGPGDETVKVNRKNIIDVRVINVGKKKEIPDRTQNWYVQVLMLMGKYYLLREEEAPYASKEEAILARDNFLSALNN